MNCLSPFKNLFFIFMVSLVLGIFSSSAHAFWNKDPEAPKRPNILFRMGASTVNALTGIFKKKDPIEEYESFTIADEGEPLVDRDALLEVRDTVLQASYKAEPTTLQAYLTQLQQLIYKNAVLPKELRGTGLKERVKVFFVLNQQGKLQKVFIPEDYRSAFGFLNEAAITAVQAASHLFPPFPPSMGKDSSEKKLFNVVIIYEDV